MKKIIALLLLLLPGLSFADNNDQALCIRIYDLKGVSSSPSNGEYFQNDEFSGKNFDFIIKDNNVYPQDPAMKDLKYTLGYPMNMFGFFYDNDKSNIETWMIDVKTTKVYFNRTRSGFPMLNGNSAYIGKVKKCNE